MPHFAAEWRGQCQAIDSGELLPDAKNAVSVQFRLAQSIRAERHLNDRHAVGCEAQNNWRLHARRHAAQDRLRNGGGLGETALNISAGMEVNLDDAHAIDRLRLHMLDVVDVRRQSVF